MATVHSLNPAANEVASFLDGGKVGASSNTRGLTRYKAHPSSSIQSLFSASLTATSYNLKASVELARAASSASYREM